MHNWKPTHLIELDSGAAYIVMFADNNAAYTQDEWFHETVADFELHHGTWLFQGEPIEGLVTPLDGASRTITLLLSDMWEIAEILNDHERDDLAIHFSIE